MQLRGMMWQIITINLVWLFLPTQVMVHVAQILVVAQENAYQLPAVSIVCVQREVASDCFLHVIELSQDFYCY